jgi:radical SAM/Cys-rich protein
VAVSLEKRNSPLASFDVQRSHLRSYSEEIKSLKNFNLALTEVGEFPLLSRKIEIFQVNLGKMCNQVCKHCHVDAGPDRKEIMTQETMLTILQAIKKSQAELVDLTGGAPEMNPYFRWFVTELKKLNKEIIVRCNLTIILANKSFLDLPQFFASNKIHVVSSLPYYEVSKTDRQRGAGVFETSIKALKLLNEVGYGKEGSGLKLDLVYNPGGAFLPADQTQLEAEFKKNLFKTHQIIFNRLLTITNMPISRFLEYLIESGNFEDYMTKLVNSFNASTIAGLMCKNTLSIGWDGALYDCDFNQMLGFKLNKNSPQNIKDFQLEKIENRQIVTYQHCYGCTAGSGSSCGGSTV